jgi:hypothetical protein
MKKKLIRSGVWETNSSSSHSVSVADDTKEFVLDTIYPDQYGIVEISGDEFGWDWFKHNDAQTKANYAAQQFAHNDDSLELLKEVIASQTGAQEVVFVGLNSGYVDHDSMGILETSKEWLKNFIFNKNSWLFGGNDNSTADPTFYDVPEFKDGKQIVPRYKYELVIEGFNKTTKFLENPNKEQIEKGLSALLDDVYLSESGYFDDDNSIMAQIRRDSSKTFRYSYRKLPNLKKGIIYFIKESWGEARKIWERDFGTNEWNSDLGYKKCCEIEKKLLSKKNSPFVKEVKFTLKEI